MAMRGVPSIGGWSICMLLLLPSVACGGVTSITLLATGVRSAESEEAGLGLQGVLVTVMFG